ncbi:hypothetical protein [Cytobacillus gottheilii]|uniref:hypothetical protein n=1 Tax=Cytobacillus gottheilii TaxID=859144 RepID=UPI001C5887E8|nr:hypothetical protein [Cytobacillus gottheilii]
MTILAFLYKRNHEVIDSNDTYSPLYLVIAQGTSINENPKVAIYKETNQEPVLAIYEVDISNGHKFSAIQAVTLKGLPEKLSNDESNRGIWVYMSNDWLYLDELLKVADRDEAFKMEDPLFEVELTTEKKEELHKKGVQKPTAIHSLTADQDLWLVVEQDGSFNIVENLQD